MEINNCEEKVPAFVNAEYLSFVLIVKPLSVFSDIQEARPLLPGRKCGL